MDFSSRLLSWYRIHGRDLPWRGSQDPYAIWISEIILQQTRVDQGKGYFFRFLTAFPNVESLASATQEEVLRMWQGLGYYSRARNLHEGARQIVEEFGGLWPASASEWQRVKGVGPYTAAAISSIAFGEAIPALDGNAFRVFARFFALEENMDTAGGKKLVQQLALDVISVKHPGDFNQAVMDFGSLVCKPSLPRCASCIFALDCLALQRGLVDVLPFRKPKAKKINRFFNYFFFVYDGEGEDEVFFMAKRKDKDIWENLYEFPMLESLSSLTPGEVCNGEWYRGLFPGEIVPDCLEEPLQMTHQLTHQTIHAKVFRVLLSPAHLGLLRNRFVMVNKKTFHKLPKSRLVEGLMNRISLI